MVKINGYIVALNKLVNGRKYTEVKDNKEFMDKALEILDEIENECNESYELIPSLVHDTAIDMDIIYNIFIPYRYDIEKPSRNNIDLLGIDNTDDFIAMIASKIYSNTATVFEIGLFIKTYLDNEFIDSPSCKNFQEKILSKQYNAITSTDGNESLLGIHDVVGNVVIMLNEDEFMETEAKISNHISILNDVDEVSTLSDIALNWLNFKRKYEVFDEE